MKRPIGVVAVMCALLGFVPSTAQSETSYFSPYSSDGVPISAEKCGVNYNKTNWVVRGLQGIATSEVGLASSNKKTLTATLLVRHSDEKFRKLEIHPEAIRLYVVPGSKFVRPSSIERKPFDPDEKDCSLQVGEWITLTFPVQPEQVERVALAVPRGTVSRGETIDVQPFRFERIDHRAGNAAGPLMPAFTVPDLPPASPPYASFESRAAVPGKVKGTWIVDGKATEELIAKTPRPAGADKLAQWFGLAASYSALMMFEFDGNLARLIAPRGGKTFEFERDSDQDTETTYRQTNAIDAKPQTMSVSMLKSGHIRIAMPTSPEMNYVRWKPGSLATNPEDVMTVARVWLESVQRIVNTLNAPVAANSVKRSSSGPQATLDDALRRGVIRRATENDVRAFRDAYFQKKYTSKNLPVPANDNALAVTKTDVSRAYVVLGNFTFPLGMTSENSFVFFIPKGVREPDGEWGHSAIYDFETLTVACTAARTEGFGC